jgi:hypothetical protein
MGRVKASTCIALVAALGLAAGADAKAPARAKRTTSAVTANPTLHRTSAMLPRQVRARVAYAPRAAGVARGRGTGFADLVGDPYSGYGFHPLPIEIRIAAARYRFVHRRFWWQNPVLAAMAADAIRNPCWIPAGQEYRCGVYNPIDGVGTPFFAGYYR